MQVAGTGNQAGVGMTSDSFQVDGVTLGMKIEGSGTALLVVGSSIFYPRTFSEQLKRSCQIACADLPHFVSPGRDFDLSRIHFYHYTNYIDAVRHHVELERVVIMGHSHHGNIALEYAKRFPHHVSHIVLIGTPPADITRTVDEAGRYWDIQASEARKSLLQTRRSAMDEKAVQSLSPEQAYITQYVTDAPLYWHKPDYDAAWLWQGMRFEMSAIHAFRDLYCDYQITENIDRLQAPILVVMGRDDYAVPHTLWKNVLPGMPNVTFQVLDKSGHTPQLEQPENFDSLLLNWLNDKA